jgi:putative drug exporter of the RND superfamily
MTVHTPNTDTSTGEPVERPFFPRMARKLALPIFVFWVVIAALVTVFVPSLEKTVAANAQALVPRDSPSSQDAVVEGRAFHESDYTSAAVILLETDGRKLGEQDHQYYDELVRQLLRDKEHVQSLLNLWGKPVTKSGQQSADAEAATLTVRPAGDTGEASASHSIAAIRDIVAKLPRPAGLNVYVSGPGPLSADTDTAATDSMTTLTVVSIIVIIIMLLLAYGSIGRALMPLVVCSSSWRRRVASSRSSSVTISSASRHLR